MIFSVLRVLLSQGPLCSFSVFRSSATITGVVIVILFSEALLL